MKSSSIKLAKEAGINNAREYRDALIHDWYLSPIFAEKLVVFIQRETPSKELFTRMKDGEIKIGGNTYSIVWINHPTEIKKKYSHALVSLRYCKHLERGYILVKALQGSGVFPELVY